MNVLLLSMPDTFEHMAPVAVRMPNGALTSLAGNVDAGHRVAVADLILARDRVRATVEHLVRSHRPSIVGLSSMIFQRRTAHAVIRLVRALRPHTRIVVGGYDPSLAPEAYTDPALGVDVIVRGEGEMTFREVVRATEAGHGPSTCRTCIYCTAPVSPALGKFMRRTRAWKRGAAPRGVEPSPRIRNYRFFRLGRWTDLIRALSFAFGVDFSPEVAPLAVSNTDTNSKAAPAGTSTIPSPGSPP